MANNTESSYVVMKFGGTSVANLKSWQIIKTLVDKRIEDGERPVVVCSAVSGVSNLLEKIIEYAPGNKHAEVFEEIKSIHKKFAGELSLDAKEIITDEFEELDRLSKSLSYAKEHASKRLYAKIMALGELMCTKLGAAYLNQNSTNTLWLDARQIVNSEKSAVISNRADYLSAKCDFAFDEKLLATFDNADSKALLTQGFIGSNLEGETILLGRGGSDTSAAIIAAKIKAKRLEIWTDVPGIYTANPRLIRSARLLKSLDYEEAQEICSTGASVLHPACIVLCKKASIPLSIHSSQYPEMRGTLISNEEAKIVAQIKAISVKKNVMLISMESFGMWQHAGFMTDAFAVFKSHGLSIDMVSTSQTSVTVSLDTETSVTNKASIDALLADLSLFCDASAIGPHAFVSLVGRNIRSIFHMLGPAFSIFEHKKIYLISQASNDLNLSFVVDEDEVDKVAKEIHSSLFKNQLEDKYFGQTWEEVFGEQKAARLAQKDIWWQTKRQDLLDLTANETPLFVYDRQTLENQADKMLSLKSVDRVFYAMKANWNEEILKIFYKKGIGFECVSPSEVEYVFKLFPDIDPKRILFTINFAPRSEYEYGLSKGINVTLESLYPLEHWPELFKNKEIILRFDPGKGRGHHIYVKTAGNKSKFGIAESKIEKLKTLLEKNGTKVVGLHVHSGSGILTPDAWQKTALFLHQMAKHFDDIRFIDLGGGLGVAEKPGQSEIDMKQVDSLLLSVKKDHPNIEYWLEPGRFLVATAGVILAGVTQTKQKESFNYVGIDAGMNMLLRPMLYGSYHQIVNLSKLGRPLDLEANIVGPICETGDTLGYDRRIQSPDEGDTILIATTGAYGRSMSSSYNLRHPAKEILIN